MTKAVNCNRRDADRNRRLSALPGSTPREWHTIDLTMKVTPTHRLLDVIYITNSTERVRQSISPMPGHVHPPPRELIGPYRNRPPWL
jgi:hypothetical protein